jgi:polysaccharide pyruvyl transferase WcaK-like protein
LEALLNSEEFKRKQFAVDAHGSGLSGELLDAAYRGMLGRPVDRNGLNEYAKRITKASDLSSVITALRKSNEFRKYFGELEKSPEPPGTWHEVVARIEGLYLRYLERPASAQEIAQYLTDETPLWQIQGELMDKAAPRTGPLRVLLFGAFGNGNMGDAYQALAVRSHLHQRFGDRPVEMFACSLLSSSDYCYPEEYKLSPHSILDADLVNGFDFLVIGGGGLLAHPHDPLADAKWCRSILTPMILLAIGASQSEVARHHTLLRQALHVVGRDQVSVAAMRTVRPDVQIAADPILSLTAVQEMLKEPFHQFSAAVQDSVLWVLKYPSNDDDKVLFGQIRRYINENSHQRHVIVGIEPALDHVLIEEFSEVEVLLTENLDELCQHISRARQVFSMRYHGAIFALLMNRAVVGASQPKLRELARKLGHLNGYLERGSDVAHEMWEAAVSASPAQLAELGKDFTHMMRALRFA